MRSVLVLFVAFLLSEVAAFERFLDETGSSNSTNAKQYKPWIDFVDLKKFTVGVDPKELCKDHAGFGDYLRNATTPIPTHLNVNITKLLTDLKAIPEEPKEIWQTALIDVEALYIYGHSKMEEPWDSMNNNTKLVFAYYNVLAFRHICYDKGDASKFAALSCVRKGSSAAEKCFENFEYIHPLYNDSAQPFRCYMENHVKKECTVEEGKQFDAVLKKSAKLYKEYREAISLNTTTEAIKKSDGFPQWVIVALTIGVPLMLICIAFIVVYFIRRHFGNMRAPLPSSKQEVRDNSIDPASAVEMGNNEIFEESNFCKMFYSSASSRHFSPQKICFLSFSCMNKKFWLFLETF
ncbi:unnamed protein product, partial [Mesorhabditis belari]|uniref:Uncharacterized protein n=1 Tax=Mesorhabditis belari TaxID=2138241 RepID=A0AAF3EWX3_9BILA